VAAHVASYTLIAGLLLLISILREGLAGGGRRSLP
jgi:hypothetical protein